MKNETNLKKREYCERVIDAITAELKQPLANIVRALLVADRQEFREELGKLNKELAEQTEAAK